jgi:hypothetical protein
MRAIQDVFAMRNFSACNTLPDFDLIYKDTPAGRMDAIMKDRHAGIEAILAMSRVAKISAITQKGMF